MAWKKEREELLNKIRQLESENDSLRHRVESLPQGADASMPAMHTENTAPPQQPLLSQQMAAALLQLTNALVQVSTVLGQFAAGQVSDGTAAVPVAIPVSPAAASLPVQDVSAVEETVSPAAAVSQQEAATVQPEESIPAPDEVDSVPDETVEETAEPVPAPAEEAPVPEDSSIPPEQPAVALDLADSAPEENAAQPEEPVSAPGEEESVQPEPMDQPEDIPSVPVEEIAPPEDAAAPEEPPASVSEQEPATSEDIPVVSEETAEEPAAAEAETEDIPAEPAEAAPVSADPAVEPEQTISPPAPEEATPEEVPATAEEAIPDSDMDIAPSEEAPRLPEEDTFLPEEDAEIPAAAEAETVDIPAEPAEAAPVSANTAVEPEQTISPPAPEEVPAVSAEAIADSDMDITPSEETPRPPEEDTFLPEEDAEIPAEAGVEAKDIPAEPAEAAPVSADTAVEPDQTISPPASEEAAPEEVPAVSAEAIADSDMGITPSEEALCPPEEDASSEEEALSPPEEDTFTPEENTADDVSPSAGGTDLPSEEQDIPFEDLYVAADDIVAPEEQDIPFEDLYVAADDIVAPDAETIPQGQPEEPEEPDGSKEPEGSEESEEPEEPEEPDKSEEPEESEEPDKSEEPEESEEEIPAPLYATDTFQHFSPFSEASAETTYETEDGAFTLFSEDQEDPDTDQSDSAEPIEGETSSPAQELDPENPLTLGARIPDVNLQMVTADSPKELKLELFWDFFCPREEVYALRWEDKKNGKAGYNFKCRNLFDPMNCPKSWAYQGKYKPPVSEKGKSNACNGCPAREYVPLTKDAVLKHLRRTSTPSDVIGMYSILPGDKCRFLALDFDEGDWQDCVRTIRQICQEWTIPCAVERSRSGNGAHIWIFFSEPVQAKDARKLGSFIITEAGKRSKSMKLTAYDRMFPAQDTMPAGGLGSLIALPFQGCAAKGSDPQQFNSVFIDENFQTIPDQWAYLASLYRLSKADLLAHLQMHQKEFATGVLVQNREDAETGPHFTWFRRTEEKLTAQDFHGKARVFRSNMLYLPQQDLTPRARDRIMRLASFSNKDFYQKQAMRQFIRDVPRVISAAEERGNYLAIPRGCEKAMIALFRERNIPYTIEDRTTTGTPIDVSFVGKLWPDQAPAAEAMLKDNLGVLSATTAFGKTVVGAWIIAQRKVNTLILVDKETLQQQWIQRLEQFLLLPEPAAPAPDPNAKPKRGRKPKAAEYSPIGKIGGGAKKPTGIVDVATFQSLWDKKTGLVNPIIRDYGMIIVDECHHVAAESFQQIVMESDARYLLGLSATPNRTDSKGPLVRFILGPIRYRVSAKEQAEKDGLTRVLIPRFTNFREPFTLDHPWELNDACQAMIDDKDRNARIIQDVKDAIEQGRSPLVLTQRVEHARKLEGMLKDLPAQVISLTGKDSPKERRRKQELLLHLQPEEPLVLIATGQYAGEGFDLSRLDTLMLTMPVSSQDLVQQFVGRLNRAYQGKSTVYVYDYVDHQITKLLGMYQKRLRAYAESGYSVRSNSTVPPEGNRLFTEKDYRKTFQDDLSQARSQVILSGRLLTQTKVQDFLKRLRPGVSAEIFLPATEDLTAEEETSLAASLDLLYIRNIPVHRIPGCCQEFAVLDQKLLWYGGLDLLGKPDTDCGCMRLQSPELSADLLHIADDWRDLATDEQTRIPL